jgi:hypothetical protein
MMSLLTELDSFALLVLQRFQSYGLRRLRAGFVPQGQPEISQTRSVWFIAQDEIRPEGTAEIHRPFRTDKFIGCVTSHFVAG